MRSKITPMDRAALSTKRQPKTLPGDLLPWSTPNRSLAIHIVTIMHTLHYSQAMFTSTADPELDQMINRMLAATDVAEVERLVGEMHRYLYDHATTSPSARFTRITPRTRRSPNGMSAGTCTTTIRAISLEDSLHSSRAW